MPIIDALIALSRENHAKHPDFRPYISQEPQNNWPGELRPAMLDRGDIDEHASREFDILSRDVVRLLEEMGVTLPNPECPAPIRVACWLTAEFGYFDRLPDWSETPGVAACAAGIFSALTHALVHAAAEQQNSRAIDEESLKPVGGGEQQKPPRISADEANLRAREALKASPPKGSVKWSIRTLAKAIGCSTGLIGDLPAWQVYAEQHGKKQSSLPIPKAVTLTPALEAVTGADDPELRKLIAEQTADFEPSPLLEPSRRVLSRRKKA